MLKGAAFGHGLVVRTAVVGIAWEDSRGIGKALAYALCRVERSAAQSRHLAADRVHLWFATRSLHSGLRPTVEMTSGGNESQSVSDRRPLPPHWLFRLRPRSDSSIIVSVARPQAV